MWRTRRLLLWVGCLRYSGAVVERGGAMRGLIVIAVLGMAGAASHAQSGGRLLVVVKGALLPVVVFSPSVDPKSSEHPG